MATQTQHYQLSKPEWSDRVDVRVLNSNMDVIDAQMYDNEQSAANAVANMAAAYDDTQTYDVDDFCIYGEALYKCTTAVTVAEAFDSTKWTQTTAAENFGSGGGGNANERVLTTAEYNALTEAEKMNNTTYYINDAIPEGKEIQPVIYSTEEREIGVWTDGKPLYQLTMVFPSNFSINGTGTALPNDMQTALADVDVLIDAEVCRDNTIASFISPYVYKSSGTWYVIAFDNWENCKWITFRYTKTTDTAGSGIWTPSGVPAVHYSTDEHVIGTWIDGSAIYEKTFELSSDVSISYTEWTSISGVSIPNLNKFIEAKGISNSGTSCNLNAYNNNGTPNFLACRDGHPVSAKYITIRYTKSS